MPLPTNKGMTNHEKATTSIYSYINSSSRVIFSKPFRAINSFSVSYYLFLNIQKRPEYAIFSLTAYWSQKYLRFANKLRCKLYKTSSWNETCKIFANLSMAWCNYVSLCSSKNWWKHTGESSQSYYTWSVLPLSWVSLTMCCSARLDPKPSGSSPSLSCKDRENYRQLNYFAENFNESENNALNKADKI